MFNNVALDVAIGLVFIYLLYSLLATVLAEIIATYIGLRARNLKEAIDRMLNDEDDEDRGILSRLWDTLKLMKNPKNSRITNFYNHPEIKYLGSTGIFKTPSQFKAISFSKTILFLLNEMGYKKLRDGNTQMQDPDEGDIVNIPVTHITKERIEAALNGIIEEHKSATGYEKDKIVLDEETAKYVLSLWKDSYSDLVKFRLHLETWFDRTMEQCLEWYKRKIQVVLLVLGFMLAWLFNADTFTIIRKLSNDKDARQKMVTLAAASIEANQAAQAPVLSIPPEKLDSLIAVKDKLQQDINEANTILGLGGWPADSVLVKIDPSTKKFVYLPQVDEEVVMDMKGNEIAYGNYVHFYTTGEKFEYFLRLIPLHFFGFLITAIAISLGAPFWFDLLNKLMKLRTAVKQPIRTPQHSADTGNDGYVSPINREG